MSSDWDLVSYVISSSIRVAVLGRLAEGPATPSQIADDTDVAISQVSRAIRQLRTKSLVELLVSESRKKGRLYGITTAGEAVAETIDEQDLG